MKTIKNVFAPAKFLLTFFIGLLLATSATAQNVQYRNPANPDQGYWQIVTNAESKSTVIKFFNGQKNQIYEEIIPGKYIKLSSRNINKINKAFDQIAGKTMVLAQVKADPLTSPAFRKIAHRQSKKKNLVQKESVISNLTADSRLKAHAYQTHHTNKFHLILKNPDIERLNIYVLNNVGQSVYHEVSSIANYSRRFNFEGLDYGKYKIVVSSPGSKQKYIKQIEVKSLAQLNQEKLPEPVLDSNQEWANR